MQKKKQILRVYSESSIVDGMMDNAIFNSILVISGCCAGNNERLCAMKFRLRLGRFRLDAGLEPGNARSEGKLNPLSYRGSFS